MDYCFDHAVSYSTGNSGSLCNEKNVYNTCLEWGCSLCNQTTLITKWLVAGIRRGRQSAHSVHQKKILIQPFIAMLMEDQVKA